MLGQDQTIITVAPARPNTRERLRKWAARRTRQLLRVLGAVTFVLVVGVVAVLFWRQACLFTLPDIGDPFDKATMDTGAVAADRGAFVIFRQATSRLTPWPGFPRSVLNASTAGGWSSVDPKIREWVGDNRDALALFKQAAEQGDGRAHHADKGTTSIYEHVYLGHFVRLAALEGSRLEDGGDIADAWAWYRAVIRMRALVMRRGTAFERWFASFNAGGLQPRVAAWAVNPKTQVSDLRRALDDVIARQRRPEWDASSLIAAITVACRRPRKISWVPNCRVYPMMALLISMMERPPPSKTRGSRRLRKAPSNAVCGQADEYSLVRSGFGFGTGDHFCCARTAPNLERRRL